MSGINILAVLVAVLASAALGALWYSPALFLKPWVRAAGREPRQSPAVYAATFLSALVAAFAFAWWLGPEPALESAILRALIAGACFVAASLGVNYAFRRPGAHALAHRQRFPPRPVPDLRLGAGTLALKEE